MKSLLLSITMIAMSTISGSAQGRVAFNNMVSLNAIYAITLGPAGSGTVFVGSEYQTQLLFAPGIYSSEAEFSAANPSVSGIATFFGTTGAAPAHGPYADGAGIFDGGVVQVGPTGTYTVQQRVWFNGGQYPTYAAAVAAGALADTSVLVQMNAPASPNPIPNTIVPSFTLGRFDVQFVPEPPTFALAGLGIASLLLLRRRK